MSRSVEEKRWAILPPPSVNSSVSGQFELEKEVVRRHPVRRTTSGELRPDQEGGEANATPTSSVNELEPSDSERITEVPPESRRRFGDANLETIPAPAWPDEE